VPILVASNLSKSFGAERVLDDVAISLATGERVGLVGLNGSGKSTLARILAGIDVGDTGTVSWPRGSKIAYLPQVVELEAAATAREVVIGGLTEWSSARERHRQASAALERGDGDLQALLEEQARAGADVERLGGWDLEHRADAILGHVGVVERDRIAGELSGGDRRRVALARILVASPDLAILDEPSNHLDVDTVAWLERFLIDEHKGALLLITHDRYLLDRVVSRTVELDHGKVNLYEGGYEAFLEGKAERLALAARTESNRQNFLRRELEWLRRQPKARTGKQKARIQRVEGVAGQRAHGADRTVKLAVDGARTGKTILELQDITLRLGDRTLATDVSLIVGPGERIGIVGPNGVGKTTLLRCIRSEIEPAHGRVVIGRNTRIAYFDQHRTDLDDDASVFDNVAGPRTHVSLGGREVDVHAYLERFLFGSHQFRQPVRSLSGGERARVALAKLLSHGANLIMLDEPTNDLDVATLSALESLLLEFDGCVLAVTHDRWFLNRVATAILAFDKDGVVRRYAGNYDSFCEQRERMVPMTEQEAAAPAKRAAAKEKKKRGLTYAEQLELDGLLDRIAEAESAVASLDEQLAAPSLYAERGEQVPALQVALSVARERAEQLTSRWEDLERRKEEAERADP
jgi:ATP-binding cassette subfamily F protein uup